MKLRCYCCGEPVDEQRFALVTYGLMSDRVFTFKVDHVSRLDKGANIMLVKRVAK